MFIGFLAYKGLEDGMNSPCQGLSWARLSISQGLFQVAL
jgi:hypothetical protein